ncbi:GbsR/MarR family transcriptional regulator [Comamonas sp. B-9]|uniref:GbsR/MarR family transcriptional regulator n=1 Tax=Comamonas sp. B-9 TaxID=1055192 RepID=UPI0019553CCF|nr:MarR family transcriptional regulator [Comamonas sp. B-9]
MTQQDKAKAASAAKKAHEALAARELFIERNAIQAETSGLPRIAGRLIGIFLLDGGPISFAELAERMQASRASVSTNTRLLERLGIIERVAMRGERQDFFSLRANPFLIVLEQSIADCRRFTAYVDELLTGSPLPADATARLKQAQDFHAVTAQTLQELLAKLAERQKQAAAQPVPVRRSARAERTAAAATTTPQAPKAPKAPKVRQARAPSSSRQAPD